MDKKSLQEQFEALPLMVAILNDSFIYVDQTNEYAHPNLEDNRVTLGYVNGAWYAFQHQQAKVEELQKRLYGALKETQYALQYVEGDMRGNHEFLKMAMIRTFKALEQALKGEG